MKKMISAIMISMMLFTMIGNSFAMATVVEPPAQPMYVAVQQMKPKVTIMSGGMIGCTDTVRILPGYSVDATWELQIYDNGNWATQNTWTSSGGPIVSLNKTRYSVPDSLYRLKTSLVVYNSNDVVVERVTKTSLSVST